MDAGSTLTRATVKEGIGEMEVAEGTQIQDVAPTEVVSSIQGHDAPAEKMLKQSEVNELVGRIKHEAYTKGLREGGVAQQPSSMGGMPQVTEDQIRKLISDEAQKQTQTAAAHSMLANFAQQMDGGKTKYSDFGETVAGLGDLRNIPHIVQLATETGMADDVLYDLGKNPKKVATLTILSSLNPELAKIEAQKLKDSILKNQAASKSPEVPDPLSQITPSTVVTDNGSRSVKDLRRMPWAKA
jgi:hypothetical protein